MQQRGEPGSPGVVVIALDRWGRVLLQREPADAGAAAGPWALPFTLLAAAEAPDEAALRAFEERTGCLLERLALYGVHRSPADGAGPSSPIHVYFDDADLDVANIAQEGWESRYFTVPELGDFDLAPRDGVIVREFVVSTAYRAMFH